MADHDGGDGDDNEGRSYGQYQIELYKNGALLEQPPEVTTDPTKLQEQARKAMPSGPFNYIYGGAGEGATMDANRLAFRQWKIIPRFLRPTLPRDLSIKLFGQTYPSPVVMAPIGVMGAYHEDREVGVAAACAELGVPFTLSTASTSSIEEVAEASGEGSARWFQLYWPNDEEFTASILSRAKNNGYTVLVVTLDTFTMSWRPLDLDAGFLPFVKGQGVQVGFSDPVFRRKFAEMSDGETPEDNQFLASQMFIADVFSGNAHSWEDLKVLKKYWDGPIVLKGILSAQDARLALEHGMDGVIVSNHGGRQMDGAVPSLEMLPEIVDAVGDQMTVLFDSGIRTGADIIKALCLGAKAVLVGRPVMYGLGIRGKEGARHVLAGLLADLDQSMGLSCVKNIGELNKDKLRRVMHGGDVKAAL
ncbi:FMN-dependent alpha-hydroxy acid dehydrogenase [Cryphonectria parasitica EP155]|uniref:FMN-dependent alpha-hydroxy acid dehydrogenase n=1 Tax=Cryphonectria parasitica (strain ATCC 38755 / EP155) TaxID=660469 RepID=A0A9P5CPC9_CRYP1|nr:FMN-dependent alpha-hydroxy acid dehydrogenase [Cryphonectria parasitica EP155]KAF3764885.1 FMN-dependent alpha-hydroxy acid dehydrogenase [Cryphonectria parasitica EP155]